MRNITTAYDFSIIAPNSYAYIFSPNVLTVTLGTSYAANAVVSISGNSVTLSRRAINRVVLFDLMPIFESKFPSNDFNLAPSSAIVDPMYGTSFNVVVSVGSSSHPVPFSLRWGAMQHDENPSYSAIRFPYWTGKPFCINSSLEHNYWTHSIGGGASGTTPLLIPISTTSQFTYTVEQDFNVKTTTFFPVTCPSDGYYLRWVDTYGEVHYYMFYKSRERGIAAAISQKTTMNRYPNEYTDSTIGRNVPTAKDRERSFNCFASVENEIYGIISSIASSLIVHYYVAGRWVRVNVAPLTIAPQVGLMSDIEFTVELPKDYMQRL